MSENIESAKRTKYLFITGGVLSSLGKGIASASLGLLLKRRGYDVTIMKLDPYINVDPGTMNPFQHGEVYVTDDGAETDLDLGHYERFLDESLSARNNTTAGQVYFEVIQKERSGHYLGKTVQVIPHITDEIKRRMTTYEGDVDFVIIEIGGTVGDIESLPFMESARQLSLELGKSNSLTIHLTYVPYIKASGELKTKPTQHSVKSLMEHGIRPDILLCRADRELSDDLRQKIALFCNVDDDAVIEGRDVKNTIYEVPLMYAEKKLDEIILKKMELPVNNLDVETWKSFVDRIKFPGDEVRVGLVGKYTDYGDSYKSILEAFIHAGSVNNVQVNIKLVNSEQITNDNANRLLGDLHGVLVGPGFGPRGIEGKISAIKYLRKNKVPFFGICLGMQCAVVEFARDVCGLIGANSVEFDKSTKYPVIDYMEEQKHIKKKGGTMRLGAYPCSLRSGSIAKMAYGVEKISERHRHRLELNNEYRIMLEENGMTMTGVSPDERLVEIIELDDHPWFLGVQFHPELKSRAVSGHPLFISFIRAASDYKVSQMKKNGDNS